MPEPKTEAGAVYNCRIMHRRPGSPRYRFTYRAYYLLLDLDRIDDACAGSRLLSRNRFNLFSFYDRDHGNHDGGNLRAWALRQLDRFAVDLAGGRIQLLALPRVLGYGFNPISLYYCEHADGALRAVIVEVHNTFGEHHSYVLHAGGAPLDLRAGHDKDKAFHVSPLFDVSGRYRFRLTEPGERFALGIRLFDEQNTQRLAAALTGVRRRLSSRNLFGLFVRIPLMTVKVILAIHWQALKIWLRGARFHTKPAQRRPKIS